MEQTVAELEEREKAVIKVSISGCKKISTSKLKLTCKAWFWWTQSLRGIDHRLACEVELSSTSQASRRLSAMKIFYVNIICGDLRRYAATTSQGPAAYENQA